jgi:alanine racemase
VTGPQRSGEDRFPRAWVEIDADALSHNITLLKRRFGRSGQTRLMAVVKADAYGHGMHLVAPICCASGVRDFGIATVVEGITLRALLPADAAIYILAPTSPDDAPDIVAHDLIALVSDRALGRALSAAASNQGRTVTIHMEIDTGIGRAGTSPEQAPTLLYALESLPHVQVTGIATHFASADEDPADARAQHAVFADVIAHLASYAPSLLIHSSNSPGALNVPEAHHDLVRPGLLLYGIEPAPGLFAESGLDLRPVLSVKARVLLCRSLHAGATISYGRTYTVPEGGGIYATLGIGYGDGWPRRLSNTGHVLLHGHPAPIRGRICMDQIVVDVTHIPNVQAGDIATLLGTDGSETITAGALAAAIQTTPHEITTCLLPRLPRVLLP